MSPTDVINKSLSLGILNVECAGNTLKFTPQWVLYMWRKNTNYAEQKVIVTRLGRLKIADISDNVFKNIERHTAHTIVSWPNPEQGIIVKFILTWT